MTTNSLITGDLPCLRCGYNLRTLEVAGNCPECGTPVLWTLHPDTMLHQSESIQRVGHLAMTLCILNFIGIVTTLIWTPRNSQPFMAFRFMSDPLPSIPFVIFALISIGYVIVGWNIFKLPFGKHMLFTRQLILWSSIVFAGAVAVGTAAIASGFIPHGITEAVAGWLLLLLPSGIVLSQQLGVFFKWYCRALNLPALSYTSNVLGIVFAVSLILGGVAFPILLTSGGEYACFVQFPCVPGFFAACISFPMTTILLVKIAREFSARAKIALSGSMPRNQ